MSPPGTIVPKISPIGPAKGAAALFKYLPILFYNTIGKKLSSLSVRPDRRSGGADFWSQTAFVGWLRSRHKKF